MNSFFLETSVFTLLVVFTMASLRSNVRIKGTTVRPGLVVRKGVCKYINAMQCIWAMIIYLTQNLSYGFNYFYFLICILPYGIPIPPQVAWAILLTVRPLPQVGFKPLQTFQCPASVHQATDGPWKMEQNAARTTLGLAPLLKSFSSRTSSQSAPEQQLHALICGLQCAYLINWVSTQSKWELF